MLALTPFMQGIQLSLLCVSLALFLGVLYGMHVKTEHHRIEILSRGSFEKEIREQNLRKEPRVKCNLLVEIMDPQEHIAAIGRLLNFSTAGACMTSHANLRRGAPILARLPTLRKGANRISGHVVWTRMASGKTMYGIRLNHSTPTN